MTQYNSLNVKLSNSELNKLKPAIKTETDVVLRLSSVQVNDDVYMYIYTVYFYLRKNTTKNGTRVWLSFSGLKKRKIGRNCLNLAGLAQIDRARSK